VTTNAPDPRATSAATVAIVQWMIDQPVPSTPSTTRVTATAVADALSTPTSHLCPRPVTGAIVVQATTQVNDPYGRSAAVTAATAPALSWGSDTAQRAR
jgi:hypothetical protein